MKKSCNRYGAQDISRFVDNELLQNQYHELTQHLTHCTDCSRLVEQYKTLSIMFNDHADNKNLKLDPDTLEEKFALAERQSQKKSLGNIPGFFGRNIYLKLASIAAILIIYIFGFQEGVFRSTGPSAIVTSVDTDFSSVMIIETQKNHHTIIWFSET